MCVCHLGKRIHSSFFAPRHPPGVKPSNTTSKKITGIKISLSSYVDDFFGGPIRTGSLSGDENNAIFLKKQLIEIGEITQTKMNIEKCAGPNRIMDILGLTYDSFKRK